MRNKVTAALIAGGLLIGAGFATSVVSAPATADAQETADDGEAKGFFARGFEFLGGVLDDMVGNGDLSQEDADAVLAAVESAAEEARAEREATRQLLQGFLEDDVITEAEASQLPDDHPLLGDQFDEAWSDGELTREEIREVRPHPRRDAFR
ncbi:MAG: hypothetical protein WBM90_10185, partial [Acidimicrobiia bacterium]